VCVCAFGTCSMVGWLCLALLCSALLCFDLICHSGDGDDNSGLLPLLSVRMRLVVWRAALRVDRWRGWSVKEVGVMLVVWCASTTSDIRHQTSDIRRQTSDIIAGPPETWISLGALAGTLQLGLCSSMHYAYRCGGAICGMLMWLCGVLVCVCCCCCCCVCCVCLCMFVVVCRV